MLSGFTPHSTTSAPLINPSAPLFTLSHTMLPPSGGVSKATHKCWLCPRDFTSIPSHQLYYNIAHPAQGLPAEGNTRKLNDAAEVGPPADAGQGIVSGDAAGEGSPAGDTAEVGGIVPSSASGAALSVFPTPHTSSGTVSVAARRTGAGA